ncbi:Metallo-dependent phosphatase, partial [Coniochaeta hoffmannii]
MSRTRTTRFVCVSDTHNCTVKLPPGDVLIHAGDLTNQGSYSELSKAVQWLEKAPFECKIVIAGNHDLTLDAPFYSLHSQSFHNQAPQDPAKCLTLLTSSPSITYLSHSSTTVRLSSPSGPRTTFSIFGSPYSPRQEGHGLWAFQYDDDLEAEDLWARVPLDTDILVTHTPPYRHCDEGVRRRRAVGCERLREALWRVRPLVHVCGHVHEGRGAER